MITRRHSRLNAIFVVSALCFSFAVPASASASSAKAATPVANGWWTSWAICAIAPVHSEPWDTEGHQAGLAGIPWIPIPMGAVDATAHLFFGSRPLPVGDTFPDGNAHTKILWTFSEPIRAFSVTATLPSAPSTIHENVVETGPANTSPGSTEWPSSVAVPSPGCWTFTLTATTADDDVVTGTFTYIAVE